MRFSVFLFITSIFGGILQVTYSTCVVESDFGFNLNCALKKSGLFRVRNLGGVKAHIGLGFSVGDELGFRESLSNLESNRRRSTTASKLQALLDESQINKKRSTTASKLQALLAESQRQGKLNNSFMVRNAPQTSMIGSIPIVAGPPPRSLPPQLQAAMRKSDMFFAAIPPFKPIPPAPERPTIVATKSSPSGSKSNVATPALMGIAVPAFGGMPHSISRLSAGPMSYSKKKNPQKADVMAVVVPIKKDKFQDKLSSTDFALRTLQSPNNELTASAMQANSLQSFLAANNITEDALEAALLQRQQQLLAKARLKTTTTTTPRPTVTRPRNPASSIGKVMNAPREYYPVGYDKNFDDNFASRVELPETSFYCGDQKHFPGLYADEDLGCMVFHVCALTDDGLITKSFLCPESTLFDQAILKCNWWFYVDCKNSKKLYDSNIPVSKSYQLMKALTFFSGYKRESTTTTSTTAKPDEKD